MLCRNPHSGSVGILVKNSRNPDSTCNCGGQIYICGVFIILCLIWIPSRNLSVFISFLMVLPVIYTNILEGIRQTDSKILEMAKVFQVNPGKKDQIYLCIAGTTLFSLCMQAFTWDVLESRSGSRGYRSTLRFYW